MVSKIFIQSLICLKTVKFDKHSKGFEVQMREKISNIGIFEKETPQYLLSEPVCTINNKDALLKAAAQQKDKKEAEQQTDIKAAEQQKYKNTAETQTEILESAEITLVAQNNKTRGAPKKNN